MAVIGLLGGLIAVCVAMERIVARPARQVLVFAAVWRFIAVRVSLMDTFYLAAEFMVRSAVTMPLVS